MNSKWFFVTVSAWRKKIKTDKIDLCYFSQYDMWTTISNFFDSLISLESELKLLSWPNRSIALEIYWKKSKQLRKSLKNHSKYIVQNLTFAKSSLLWTLHFDFIFFFQYIPPINFSGERSFHQVKVNELVATSNMARI